ncbi:MAG: hypothetical protein QNJ91_12880 [Gammaproteobacteria bacterium]|nr:hypothetical protein [Gammaproteobacteria bacterium]
MKLAEHLLDGLKMVALCGAIALVVWSMPEYRGLHAQNADTGADTTTDSRQPVTGR